MALTEQIHIYSIDTGFFFTNNESRLYKRICSLRKQKRNLINLIKALELKLQMTVCDEDEYKHLIKYKTLTNSNYSDDEICLIIFIIKQISEYTEYKTYLTNLINNYKNKLLSKLDKAVKYNKLMSKLNKLDKLHIRGLPDTLLKTNNIISVFDSSLTRMLNMKKDELHDNIMVVKVYYFDIIKDMILNGFFYKGDKYIFLTASAGQIRTKKTVFIKESLFLKYEKTMMCGLTIPKINSNGGINVNKFLAYLALSNSATDLWSDFDIDRAIVVEDFESTIVGKVDFINDKTYSIKRKIMPVPITHTDGAGMILPSVSKKNFMCRLPWIKGLLAVFDFKKFITEQNEINPDIKHEIVEDIYGKKHDIFKENIQIIFTKSQFKMYKYFTSWNRYKKNFKRYKCQAGICNLEDDRIKNAKINYQILQTLTNMTYNELLKISDKSSSRIKNLSNTVESMLNAFGVTKYNTNKTYLQQALEIYPELLRDIYTKDVLRDIKKSLIKDYKSAKLDIEGKYTFIIPDMYAFCEYLFNVTKNPNGLLNNNDVYCRLFKNSPKVDCLRSPHLFREHAVRNNVIDDNKNKWFITDAIYTSCHDLISKILQFDVDGDRSLVVANKTLVDVAQRSMKNIVPLYYDMKKADPVILTNEEMYNGLNAAYTGGNIGAISNDITKIWNSGKMNNKKLRAIKLLCMENNFTIDYAKTLYKPVRPQRINALITQFTKSKVPYFFQYAKDKTDDQIAKKNDSLVNKLDTIIVDKKMNFSIKKFGKFDYKMLMKNTDIIIDEKLISLYNTENRTYHYKINMEDENDTNISYIAKEIKNKLSSTNYSDEQITDMLVKYLYFTKNSKSKESLWFCYGNIIVNNLKNNIGTNTNVCAKCGKRFKKINNYHKYCDECSGYQKLEIKKIKCIDCNTEFEVKSLNNQTNRCVKCYEIYRKKYKAEKEKDRRNKLNILRMDSTIIN